MRFWVNPDTLAKLDITVNEIASALQAQNTVNPAGQLGGDPTPPARSSRTPCGRRAAWRASAEFENVVVRAKPDGSLVRLKDVARVELGAQNYIRRGRLNGKPAAIIAIYQLPGLERHRDDARRDEADGGDEGAVPGRPRLRDVARHDAGRERRHARRS